MIKKISGLFLLISIGVSSCDVLHESEFRQRRASETNRDPKLEAALPAVNEPIFFSKFYRFKTGQSYTRSVERLYYGPQADMMPEMNKHDIRRGFNIEQYIKYSKASFFETDVYEIPADLKNLATDLYKPLIDSLFTLAAANERFHAEILVMGYTDESPVPYNSPVYERLLNLQKVSYFSNNDYYHALSFYRAKEVSDIVSKLLAEQKSVFKQFQHFTIDLVTEGRGIEFPDAKRNYALQDNKRKITKVYWKVSKAS